MSAHPLVTWITHFTPRIPSLGFSSVSLSKPLGDDGIPPDAPVAAISSFEYAKPASLLGPRCHVQEPQVTENVEKYFIEHWQFPDEQAIHKFQAAGFGRVTCCYFPEALNDRIVFAARLLTLLFLIDDILEDMSFEDGKAYNDILVPISRGYVLPDRKIPVQYITCDLWEDMRACDKQLADEILGPVFAFMEAQTDPKRKDIFELGTYLKYRESDVGKALLSALMRFVMGLILSPAELESLESIDMNCAKHISVVNDIYSWEKELRKSKASGEEGSMLCSSVKVLSDECSVGIDASKRILWTMCREWELIHLRLFEEKKDCRLHVVRYCEGLGYQMSGNELWSRSTKRYQSSEA